MGVMERQNPLEAGRRGKSGTVWEDILASLKQREIGIVVKKNEKKSYVSKYSTGIIAMWIHLSKYSFTSDLS